jgi:hypothetical protein
MKSDSFEFFDTKTLQFLLSIYVPAASNLEDSEMGEVKFVAWFLFFPFYSLFEIHTPTY